MGPLGPMTHEIWARPRSIVGAEGTPKNCCVNTIIESCVTSSGLVQGRRRGAFSVDSGEETVSLITPSIVRATTKTMHVLKRCNLLALRPRRYGFGVAWKA